MNSIPYARQYVDAEDVASVVEALQSDWLTQGPTVRRFEASLSERVGARYGTAVGNATQALHLSCLALELGPGDRLWTSPNTFVASANCARYCGAQVDFVDIDPATYNLCPKTLAKKLADAKRRGTLPKIVVPVHFGGQPCDMRAIAALAEEYGFSVIEDASHAVGAELEDSRVGSGRYSRITVFSFHPVKIMTSGEGGMATTGDAELHSRLQRLRTHGITRDAAAMRSAPEGGWYYEQLELGFNYRMTELQAALGLSQLGKLDRFLLRRREIADLYRSLLHDLPLVLPNVRTGVKSAWHLYVIKIDRARTGVNRRALYDALQRKGVLVNVHYIPVHLQPYYRDLGFRRGDFPEAERYYADALSLPMYFAMTDEDVRRVARATSDAFGELH